MPPPNYPQRTSVLLDSITVVPTPAPELELRQANYYITLSITRDTTTYTTTILLGGTEPAGQATAAVAATSTTSNPVAAATPASTSFAGILVPASSDPSSGVIIGAIIGSIVGSFVLVCLLWLCCFNQTPIVSVEHSKTNHDSGSSYGSGSRSSRSSRSKRKAERQPPVKVARVVRVQSSERVSPAVQQAAVRNMNGRFFGLARIPPLNDD
jgi:hypothetical protein